MPKDVKVLKVMIASPGDVPHERVIVRDVVLAWNSTHADDRRLFLHPVSWEQDASPEMGAHPQDVISRQILGDCDLLVAVFWTRLGSRTRAAASGTVQEINEHLAAGKPAMIYFSSAPVKLESVDRLQYAELMEFKTFCRNQGLLFEFESVSELKEIFTRHLAQTIIRTFARPESDKFGLPAIQQRPPSIQASADAHNVLGFAVKGDGIIMALSNLDGLTLQAGEVAILSDDWDPRNVARWRSAVRELLENQLIEDRTGRGEIYQVTQKGYVYADAMGLPQLPDLEPPE